MVESIKRYCATVAYQGTHYAGWQIQKEQPSIQSMLQVVLKLMHKRDVRIVGSGRTDAGVHALGQTFHFDSSLDLSLDAWKAALNAQLPKDIRILKIKVVDDEFHARFDVLSKRYRYKITTQELTPFNYTLCHLETRPLDLNLLKEAMSVFVGTHDFSSFNATPIEEVTNQVRTIHSFDVEVNSEGFDCVIEGDGFLRYMVRMLVAICLDVATHKLTITALTSILLSQDKRAYSGIVPAQGLYLEEVSYERI